MRPHVRVNAALYLAAIVSAAAQDADDRADFNHARVVAFEIPTVEKPKVAHRALTLTETTGSDENPRSSAAGSPSDGTHAHPRGLRAVGQYEEQS